MCCSAKTACEHWRSVKTPYGGSLWAGADVAGTLVAGGMRGTVGAVFPAFFVRTRRCNAVIHEEKCRTSVDPRLLAATNPADERHGIAVLRRFFKLQHADGVFRLGAQMKVASRRDGGGWRFSADAAAHGYSQQQSKHHDTSRKRIRSKHDPSYGMMEPA